MFQFSLIFFSVDHITTNWKQDACSLKTKKIACQMPCIQAVLYFDPRYLSASKLQDFCRSDNCGFTQIREKYGEAHTRRIGYGGLQYPVGPLDRSCVFSVFDVFTCTAMYFLPLTFAKLCWCLFFLLFWVIVQYLYHISDGFVITCLIWILLKRHFSLFSFFLLVNA